MCLNPVDEINSWQCGRCGYVIHQTCALKISPAACPACREPFNSMEISDNFIAKEEDMDLHGESTSKRRKFQVSLPLFCHSILICFVIWLRIWLRVCSCLIGIKEWIAWFSWSKHSEFCGGNNHALMFIHRQRGKTTGYIFGRFWYTSPKPYPTSLP